MGYPPDMDQEMVPLCNALNSIPGLRTAYSCSGIHRNQNPYVFVSAFSLEAMNWLLRLVNPRRYSGKSLSDQKGCKWRADAFEGHGSEIISLCLCPVEEIKTIKRAIDVLSDLEIEIRWMQEHNKIPEHEMSEILDAGKAAKEEK